MPRRIETRHHPRAIDAMHPDTRPLYHRTTAATVSALRRVGSEAIEWNLRAGPRIDSARITQTATSAAPKIFGRAHEPGEGRAEMAVEVLIDGSGSMCAEARTISTTPGNAPVTLAQAARAIAAGIADGASACGIPATIGHHGKNGRRICLAAHTDTMRAVIGNDYGGNDDAFAVSHWVRSVARIGERGALVLVCDGAPNTETESHAPECARALRALDACGYAFVLCYIGADAGGLARARAEWGAHRVADARADVQQLAPVIVRALRDVQQRASS